MTEESSRVELDGRGLLLLLEDGLVLSNTLKHYIVFSPLSFEFTFPRLYHPKCLISHHPRVPIPFQLTMNVLRQQHHDVCVVHVAEEYL
jgi:hypothetical protein